MFSSLATSAADSAKQTDTTLCVGVLMLTLESVRSREIGGAAVPYLGNEWRANPALARSGGFLGLFRGRQQFGVGWRCVRAVVTAARRVFDLSHLDQLFETSASI